MQTTEIITTIIIFAPMMMIIIINLLLLSYVAYMYVQVFVDSTHFRRQKN